MWQSVVTAGVLSLLCGLVAQPPPRYRFWRQWASRWFGVGIVFYLGCHAALGVVVALLADPVSWRPFDGNWFLAGLTFTVVGQGLVRVAPQGLTTDFASARTLLSRFIDFTVETLDRRCEDEIEASLESLPWESIAAQATWMYERFIVEDPQVPTEARALLLDQLEKATNELQGDPSHLNGRGTLERLCIRLFVSRELLPRALKGKPDAGNDRA